MPEDDPGLQTARDRIQHVVVLMLENRSFDHIFGYLDHPAGAAYPGLHDHHYPNPGDTIKGPTPPVDVSPDAEYILAAGPPHSHASIARSMNGRGWRNFKMDGFVIAYGEYLGGHENVPVVHWGRMQLVLIALAALVGAGLEDLVWVIRNGGWLAYLAWVIGVAVVLAVGVMCVGVLKLLRRPAWQYVVGIGAVAIVVGGALHVLTRHGRGDWGGFFVFLGVWILASLATVPILQQQRRKNTQRARVPPDVEPEAAARVMRCMAPEKIPVLATLAREYALCTHWHSSVPGATWPNRNFVHAATSEGSVDIEIGFYEETTIFELLEAEAKARARSDGQRAGEPWRIYHDGMAQVMAFDKLWHDGREAHWFPMERFYTDVANSSLPAYTFIEPLHDGPLSNSQHPGNNQHHTSGSTDFERGELLVRKIYDALRANPALFRDTLLLITYDEHGGLFDHVPPPRARHPRPLRSPERWLEVTRRFVAWLIETRNSPFDFRCLGVRVPAIVVSPWVERAALDDTVYDHSSVVATLRRLFAPNQGPLTRRDAAANSFHGLVTTRSTPREDLPELPPPTAPVPKARPIAAGLVGEDVEPPPPPPPPPDRLVTPAADLRDQLAVLAPRIDESLLAMGAPDAANPADRFARFSDQQRE